MVALNPRFALLAAFCSLASISLSPVDAAVIQARADKPSPTKDAPSLPIVGPLLQAPFSLDAVKMSASNNGQVNGVSEQGKHHKPRVADWSPVLRVAGLTRHHGSRRSEILIADTRGGSHSVPVSRLPRYMSGHEHTTKREQDKSSAGTIAIMSPQANSTTSRKIASLMLDASNPSKYILNASQNNHTEVYLVDAPPIMSGKYAAFSNHRSNTPVTMQMLFMDPSSASTVRYCATFDPNPQQAGPLSMERCFLDTHKEAHKCQTFSYNKQTGVVQPMWATGEDDNSTAQPSGEEEDDDGATPDAPGVAKVTNTNLAARNATGPGDAKNVTLVFVPSSLQAASIEDSAEPSGTAVTMTSTVILTTTVTGSNTAAPTPASPSASLAAVDPSPPTTPPAGSTTAVSTLTTDSASPSSTSVDTLDVEVVGPVPSASNSVSLTSSSAASGASPTSIGAQAIAPQDLSSSSVAGSVSTSVSGAATTSAEAVAASVAASEDTPTPSAADSATTSALTPVPTASQDVVPSVAAQDLSNSSEANPATTLTSTSASSTATNAPIKVEDIASDAAASPSSNAADASSTAPPTATAAGADIEPPSPSNSTADATSASGSAATDAAIPYEWMFKAETRL